jgi:hypothetical protein
MGGAEFDATLARTCDAIDVALSATVRALPLERHSCEFVSRCRNSGSEVGTDKRDDLLRRAGFAEPRKNPFEAPSLIIRSCVEGSGADEFGERRANAKNNMGLA